ncbi:MAG: transposase [Deltaproteobacteria bacterium]|nr:transposase [Deltaproteobacteria bacterium]
MPTNKSRRRFDAAFKAEVVKLVESGASSVPTICKDHGLHESSVYAWLRQSKIDAGEGPGTALTTSERKELVELRKENRELKRERDFLERAATFFATTKRRGTL